MLAADFGLRYKAFTLIAKDCFPDECSVKCRSRHRSKGDSSLWSVRGKKRGVFQKVANALSTNGG
jgi:hypothetical protein